MRKELRSFVHAGLISALAWGTVAQVSAQAPGPSQDPVTQVPPTPEEATLPESVPAYEPTVYDLTPGGTGGGRRSETLGWPNRPLMLTSTLIFVGSYVPAVMMAKFSSEDTTDNLYIPVAGPWLELAQEPASTGNKALLAVDGVLQGLGALGMLTSLLVPERRTSQWYLLGNKHIALAPTGGRSAYGVSAAGRF